MRSPWLPMFDDGTFKCSSVQRQEVPSRDGLVSVD